MITFTLFKQTISTLKLSLITILSLAASSTLAHAQLFYQGERNGNGEAHGQGEMAWRQDTCVIAGSFADGLPKGRAVLSVLYPNGRRALFWGDINSTSLSADKRRPLFDFVGNQVSYWGGNGDVYIGEQNKSGYYQGRGELHLRGGTIYKGDFRDDKFTGTGIVRFRDGSIAEGKLDEYDGGEVFAYWSGKFLRVGHLRDNQWSSIKSEWGRTRRDKDLLPRFRTLVEKLGYQTGRRELKRFVVKDDGAILDVGKSFVTYAVKTGFRGEILGSIQLERTPLYVEHCIALVESDGLIMNEMRSSFGDITGFPRAEKSEGKYTCSRTLVYSLDVPYHLGQEYKEFVSMQAEAEQSNDLYLMLRFVNRYAHFADDPTKKVMDRLITLLSQKEQSKLNAYVRHQIYIKTYELLNMESHQKQEYPLLQRIGTAQDFAKVFADYDPLGYVNKPKPVQAPSEDISKSKKPKSKRK